MSDGFDKEAEREKLREKFAEDEQKREHTQRMSELLLKGATMTNRHCGECGDPIFRHDGREFCPTCGNEVGGASAADAGGAPADAGDAPPAEPATPADEVPEGGADAATENGAVDGDAVDGAASDAGRSGASASSPAQSQPPAPPQRTAARGTEARSAADPQAETPRSSPSPAAADAESVGAARASLTRTLTRFARAAEETDDPRRARDHLEAAREAAEALAALD
ncbi:Sjogren's syndrome/scleroderma autoantigen 1 family protein [Halorubrum sp. Atlit-28R]|jgi:uncharacterized Zn finger protein (UPF0148 family)|uniref:Sjogren's syndrome/scleroderma autoantigen 1 family protein n=1 Tax=Halorubrum sp. Atlit-28R TaxID=2282129 RepID=UPI000EF1B064|nr:Sjogren's syndrome/scleroderma autoantigen 1 family protein [Halorubrum sp. Atlit-28R]RLM50496.1 hypothetical protein DVK06_09650 [Halorubrum sp. Atlit-28R]